MRQCSCPRSIDLFPSRYAKWGKAHSIGRARIAERLGGESWCIPKARPHERPESHPENASPTNQFLHHSTTGLLNDVHVILLDCASLRPILPGEEKFSMFMTLPRYCSKFKPYVRINECETIVPKVLVTLMIFYVLSMSELKNKH